MREPKILWKGESTFMNGGGGICGGVMSRTEFFKDVEANMMAYYMEDENFELYKRLKNSKGKADQKAATELFKKCAISLI